MFGCGIVRPCCAWLTPVSIGVSQDGFRQCNGLDVERIEVASFFVGGWNDVCV